MKRKYKNFRKKALTYTAIAATALGSLGCNSNYRSESPKTYDTDQKNSEVSQNPLDKLIIMVGTELSKTLSGKKRNEKREGVEPTYNPLKD